MQGHHLLVKPEEWTAMQITAGEQGWQGGRGCRGGEASGVMNRQGVEGVVKGQGLAGGGGGQGLKRRDQGLQGGGGGGGAGVKTQGLARGHEKTEAHRGGNEKGCRGDKGTELCEGWKRQGCKGHHRPGAFRADNCVVAEL